MAREAAGEVLIRPVAGWDREDLDYEDLDAEETPLYSDIVLRNLELKSKTVLETIKFDLPTSRLCVRSRILKF